LQKLRARLAYHKKGNERMEIKATATLRSKTDPRVATTLYCMSSPPADVGATREYPTDSLAVSHTFWLRLCRAALHLLR
jgi:hypothetical protein